MKRTLLILGMVVAFVGFMSVAAQATLITGEVDFNATNVVLNGTLSGATAITSIGATTVTGATDSFLGTAGDSATFTAFTFNPTGPVSPLWTYTDVVTGWTYTFDASTMSVLEQDSSFLRIGGSGSVTITGAGSPYTATEASWTFTSTGKGISFVASTTAVPEPATLLLLGFGLLGLGLIGLRWKRKI